MNVLLDAREFRVTRAKPTILGSFSALVVEDHALIALDLENMLYELGSGQVLTANSVAGALRLIESKDFDVAFLDMCMGGTVSADVALALRERGVPFAYATGCASLDSLPKHLQHHPLITKPYLQHHVAAVLGLLFGLNGEH